MGIGVKHKVHQKKPAATEHSTQQHAQESDSNNQATYQSELFTALDDLCLGHLNDNFIKSIDPQQSSKEKDRLHKENTTINEFRAHLVNLNSEQINTLLASFGNDTTVDDILSNPSKLANAANTITPKTKMLAACNRHLNTIEKQAYSLPNNNKDFHTIEDDKLILSILNLRKKISELSPSEIDSMKEKKVDFTNFSSISHYFQSHSSAKNQPVDILPPRELMLKACKNLKDFYQTRILNNIAQNDVNKKKSLFSQPS